MVRAMTLRLLRSFFSTYFLASNSGISPPKETGKPEVSKVWIGLTPLLPWSRASQKLAKSRPMGLATPIPVNTARREEDRMAHLHSRKKEKAAQAKGSSQFSPPSLGLFP